MGRSAWSFSWIMGMVLASQVLLSGDSHAFGRKEPKPEPVPVPEPTSEPSPVPTSEPTPEPSVPPSPLPPALTEVKLGEIAVAGTGCAEGTVAIERSADGRILRLLPTELSVAVGRENRDRPLDRKACTLAVPVLEVPLGHRLVVVRTEVRGAARVARWDSGKASLETFAAGGTGERIEREVGSEADDDIRDLNLVQEGTAITDCAGNTGTIRSNVSVWLKRGAVTGRASSVVLTEIEIELGLESCEGAEGR